MIQSLPRTELSVWAYYWFPNNKGLATYGLIGELYISENPFDPSTANQLENITSTGSYRNQMCFTSDGKYIILINSNGLEVYDPASGKLIKNISTSNYESITLSNDESKFIVCRNGFTTKIFEVGTWEQIGQIQTPGVSCAAWSPDDKKVALGRVSRNTSFANALVSIYDHSDKSNPSLSGEFRVEGNLTAIAWNSTGTKIVTGGENTFMPDTDDPQLPGKVGLQCVGGIVKHLGALTAIGCSTVNSYRRLWDTGFWAPVFADWGFQNRTTGLRISAPGRFEYRAVDSMVNPYLLGGALLKAFEDGIDNDIDPGQPENRNIYQAMEAGKQVKKLPMSLGDALDRLANDDVIKSSMPDEMYKVFQWYKNDEWERFMHTVTDWDMETYLDCLP